MIKVQLPTREHRLHELNLNYGDVVFFIGQNGSGKSSLLNNLFQKIGSQSSVYVLAHRKNTFSSGNDSNLLIVFYVQIMPDDFVMQLHRF